MRKDGVPAAVDSYPAGEALAFEQFSGNAALVLKVGMAQRDLGPRVLAFNTDAVLRDLRKRRVGGYRRRRHADKRPQLLAHRAKRQAKTVFDEIDYRSVVGIVSNGKVN